MKLRHIFTLLLGIHLSIILFAPALAKDFERSASSAQTVHLIHDVPAQNPDGTINAVIEIPAGTNEKWEVEKESGRPALEHKNGKPRIIKYLGYPGNYGMIPQTILSEELGGDGDPLDVLVIGGPLERGHVVPVRLIGVLKFLDDGEQDDKLITVLPGTALDQVGDVADLMTQFPGSLEIIRIWFENYKGPGTMAFQGTGSRAEAETILQAAMENYNENGTGKNVSGVGE